MFHDEEYYLPGFKEQEQKLREELMSKVDYSISQDKALLCTGYYLPDVTIKRNFVKPVYFMNCKFKGMADFSRTTFFGEADFSSATFSGNANFSGATFSKEADFLGSTFSKEADFSTAKFSAETYYSGSAYFVEAQFHGKVNFSKANFSGAAHFGLANFSEGVHFFRAKFSKEAMFTQARFKEAYFSEANFSGAAYFNGANFKGADFSRADFSGTTYFKQANFLGESHFNYVLFEDGRKIWFEVEDLSNVDFLNTDITRIRFSDRAKWGKKDRFKVIEEQWLEDYVKDINLRKKDKKLREKTKEHYPKVIVIVPKEYEIEKITLDDVMTVYRNLRENYEFRLRYDEAGKFFINEMELKRKYTYSSTLSCRFKNKLYHLYKKPRRDGNSQLPQIEYKLRKNNLLERNLSLTGLYHLFSNYGESIVRPTLIGVITVGLSTLFWLMQSNPTLQPTFSSNAHIPYSNFTGLVNATNHIQLLKAFERSIADFLPLLSLPGDIKVGVIDYIIKIVGGALTFGLIIIALRRKFERKYTR